MPKSKCCSKRSIQLRKINKVKAIRAAGGGTPCPGGGCAKKTAKPKKAPPQKAQPCRQCKAGNRRHR